MILTEQEHRRLAALMDQAARRKWLTQQQREEYLRKATRFRLLARIAAQLAKEKAAKPTPALYVVKAE
jgi:hypothetical protein